MEGQVYKKSAMMTARSGHGMQGDGGELPEGSSDQSLMFQRVLWP